MASDSTTQLQLLLNRVREGDAEALDQLTERACLRVHNLVRKIFPDFQRVRRFEDSSDVLQEVLLRLNRRMKNLAEKEANGQEGNLPANVRQFFHLASNEIRNALLDLARKYFGPQGQGRHQAMALHPSAEDSSAGEPLQPSDHSHDPNKLMMWTEFHGQVESLPTDLREVFDLRWYQGLSSEEVAEILGVSLATVKRRWLQARLALRSVLEEHLPEG